MGRRKRPGTSPAYAGAVGVYALGDQGGDNPSWYAGAVFDRKTGDILGQCRHQHLSKRHANKCAEGILARINARRIAAGYTPREIDNGK